MTTQADVSLGFRVVNVIFLLIITLILSFVSLSVFVCDSDSFSFLQWQYKKAVLNRKYRFSVAMHTIFLVAANMLMTLLAMIRENMMLMQLQMAEVFLWIGPELGLSTHLEVFTRPWVQERDIRKTILEECQYEWLMFLPTLDTLKKIEGIVHRRWNVSNALGALDVKYAVIRVSSPFQGHPISPKTIDFLVFREL